jgi:magnesium-transporting ATPase (P-type)
LTGQPSLGLRQDIVVGDQIKIYEGEEFPADIVFIKSAAHDHQCFIETSDLDGYGH